MAEGLHKEKIVNADYSVQGSREPTTIGTSTLIPLCLYRSDGHAVHDRVRVSDDLKRITLK